MPRTRWILVALLLWACSAASAREAIAEGVPTLADRQSRIRTTDSRLRTLLVDGARDSPTFRALVERRNASDVVAYLQCERGDLRERVDGRLVFLSSAGGFRYVVIRLSWLAEREHQLAILAHELQPAVEIADTPAIVDGPSLAREYLRIGYVNRRARTIGVAFDTQAAVWTGEQVLREVNAMASWQAVSRSPPTT